MYLSELGGLGAVGILENAATKIENNGLSLLFPCDPYSKALSIIGALALACGAKEGELARWDGDLQFAPVPYVSYAIFMELITYLESVIDGDIDQWSNAQSDKECVRMLKNAAIRIQVSVV